MNNLWLFFLLPIGIFFGFMLGTSVEMSRWLGRHCTWTQLFFGPRRR